MPQLNNDTIEYLAKLCRIACSEEEKRGILKDLNQILGYVEQLKTCETSSVEPLSSIIQGNAALSLRDDIEEPSLSKEAFLQSAPAHIAGLIKVPCILDE